MPASSDPVKRQRQLANLSRTAATKHGAHSTKVAVLAEAHRERLAGLFTDPDPELLAIQARRCAQMETLQEWLATNGLLRRSPKGTVFAAAEFHERLAAAFERTHRAMLDADRGGVDPAAALAAHVAEIEARNG